MKIKSSMGIVSIPIPSPFPSLHPSCLRSKERARSVDPSASSPSSLPSSPVLSDFFREANFFPAIFRIFEGKSDKGSDRFFCIAVGIVRYSSREGEELENINWRKVVKEREFISQSFRSLLSIAGITSHSSSATPSLLSIPFTPALTHLPSLSLSFSPPSLPSSRDEGSPFHYPDISHRGPTKMLRLE